jgi:hypothetical protein
LHLQIILFADSSIHEIRVIRHSVTFPRIEWFGTVWCPYLPLAFLCGPVAFAQLSTCCGRLFRVVASGVWVMTWRRVGALWCCHFVWRSRFDMLCVEEEEVVVESDDGEMLVDG